MKEIPLTQGKVALVDDEDFEKLNKHKWCAHRGSSDIWYAERGIYIKKTRKVHHVRMHRVITNVKKGKDVDHKNHNGLDNRKENLRICTRSQNSINSLFKKRHRHDVHGVQLRKDTKKWIVIVKKRSFGCFTDKIEAAHIYDKYAKLIYGEFAVLNFPEELEQNIKEA